DPVAEALPGDHLDLEHDGLPGQASRCALPARRGARLRAHAERDGDHRAQPDRDHGELPGRGRLDRGAVRARGVRRPREGRRARLAAMGVFRPARTVTDPNGRAWEIYVSRSETPRWRPDNTDFDTETLWYPLE